MTKHALTGTEAKENLGCDCGGKVAQSETTGLYYCTNSGDTLLYYQDGRPLR